MPLDQRRSISSKPDSTPDYRRFRQNWIIRLLKIDCPISTILNKDFLSLAIWVFLILRAATRDSPDEFTESLLPVSFLYILFYMSDSKTRLSEQGLSFSCNRVFLILRAATRDSPDECTESPFRFLFFTYLVLHGRFIHRFDRYRV
jgi:hypothetical protein